MFFVELIDSLDLKVLTDLSNRLNRAHDFLCKYIISLLELLADSDSFEHALVTGEVAQIYHYALPAIKENVVSPESYYLLAGHEFSVDPVCRRCFARIEEKLEFIAE